MVCFHEERGLILHLDIFLNLTPYKPLKSNFCSLDSPLLLFECNHTPALYSWLSWWDSILIGKFILIPWHLLWSRNHPTGSVSNSSNLMPSRLSQWARVLIDTIINIPWHLLWSQNHPTGSVIPTSSSGSPFLPRSWNHIWKIEQNMFVNTMPQSFHEKCKQEAHASIFTCLNTHTVCTGNFSHREILGENDAWKVC